MRNSGFYQLVSKHSILSAQRNNKVAAMEKLLEKEAMSSKPEWKEQLDCIKQRLERRRSSRYDELSEKDFEIYLEMKLQWLQQFYVTARSRKLEQKVKEPEEEEGWNEEFKVDLKLQNSGCCSELSNQELMLEVVDSHIGMDETTWRVNEEPEDSEKNNDGPRNVSTLGKLATNAAKSGVKAEAEKDSSGREDEIGGDIEPPWKPTTMEDQRVGDTPEESPDGDATTTEGGDEEPPEEPTPEDSPSETLIRSATMAEVRSLSLTVKGCDNGVDVVMPEESTRAAPCLGGTVTETWQSNMLGKMSLSRETELCDREENVEKTKRSNGAREGRRDISDSEPPPDPPDENVARGELQCPRVLGFFLRVAACDREEKIIRVGWSSRELDLDPMCKLLGQAHIQVSKFGHSYIDRGDLKLKVITKKESLPKFFLTS